MGLRKLGDSAYLYPGSPSTLIVVSDKDAIVVDPGHGSGRHKDIRRELKKLGLELKAQLASHGHADHVAVAGKLRAPLFLHRFEFSMAESPLTREILTLGSKAPNGFLPYSVGELRVEDTFEWDDEIFNLKTIKLNGHSPGMTGFLSEENSLLYAGDSLFGERLISSVGVPYLVDWSLFKESLARLREFAHAGYLIIPSHGTGVRGERALDLIDFNLKRLGEIEGVTMKLLRNSMGVEELTLKLMKHYDVEVTPAKLALNLVPIKALVTELYNAGILEVSVEGGLKWKKR